MKKHKASAACLLILLMILLVLSGCHDAKQGGRDEKNDSEKVYKVGIVQYVDDASLNQIESNIEKELDAKSDELGVTFNYADYTFNGQADDSTMNQIAAELMADKVDIIIPIATPVAVVMHEATEESSIPVVFAAVSDPVGAGIVESLDAPGGNVTGVSDALNTEAVLNLMLSAQPDIRKVGLLYDKTQAASDYSILTAKKYLDDKGISYIEANGTTPDEIMKSTENLLAEKVEAVFTPTDNTIMTQELMIYDQFIDAGIPHYAGADSFALNGAFCGYGVNYQDVGKETADMAVDILTSGTDPAGIPVRTLNNGIATINVETAQALGIDYSTFAEQCEEVIETTTRQEFDD